MGATVYARMHIARSHALFILLAHRRLKNSPRTIKRVARRHSSHTQLCMPMIDSYRANIGVPAGSMFLDKAQQFNLRVLPGDVHIFR